MSITTLPLSLATASDSANQFYTVGPAAMTAKHRCALGSNSLHEVEFRTAGPLGRTLFEPLDRLRVQGTALCLSSPAHSVQESLGNVSYSEARHIPIVDRIVTFCNYYFCSTQA